MSWHLPSTFFAIKISPWCWEEAIGSTNSWIQSRRLAFTNFTSWISTTILASTMQSAAWSSPPPYCPYSSSTNSSKASASSSSAAACTCCLGPGTGSRGVSFGSRSKNRRSHFSRETFGRLAAWNLSDPTTSAAPASYALSLFSRHYFAKALSGLPLSGFRHPRPTIIVTGKVF